MKKILAIMLVVLLSAFCGCANTAETEGAAASPAMADSIGSPGEGNAEGDAPADMSDRQMGTMVIGRVESITGNEVVLELGEVSGDQLDGRAFTRDSDTGDMGTPTMPSRNNSGSTRGTPPPGVTPGQRGQGGRGGGSAPSMDAVGGQGGNMPSFDLEITYTGEKATYLLPVGMQIGQGDYTSVSTGMVLRLMLDEENTIIRVSILSQ